MVVVSGVIVVCAVLLFDWFVVLLFCWFGVSLVVGLLLCRVVDCVVWWCRAVVV